MSPFSPSDLAGLKDVDRFGQLVGGAVHIGCAVPPGTRIPIGWVVVGDPARLLPPGRRTASGRDWKKPTGSCHSCSALTQWPTVASKCAQPCAVMPASCPDPQRRCANPLGQPPGVIATKWTALSCRIGRAPTRGGIRPARLGACLPRPTRTQASLPYRSRPGSADDVTLSARQGQAERAPSRRYGRPASRRCPHLVERISGCSGCGPRGGHTLADA